MGKKTKFIDMWGEDRQYRITFEATADRLEEIMDFINDIAGGVSMVEVEVEVDDNGDVSG
jgi:hypothetical protein